MSMKLISNFLNKLSSLFTFDYEKKRVEEYLNQSTSIIEVESKMREIERGRYYL